VSRRHVHLSEAHVRALFGIPTLEVLRTIRQPGQFAARQQVVVVGPKGRLDDVRVVGPARGETQVELARSDAARLGIDPPLAASGSKSLRRDLVGPHGRVELARGGVRLAIWPPPMQREGMQDGDRLDIRCGSGRALPGGVFRASAAHATGSTWTMRRTPA
jgi:putative phosphotransacetylase